MKRLFPSQCPTMATFVLKSIKALTYPTTASYLVRLRLNDFKQGGGTAGTFIGHAASAPPIREGMCWDEWSPHDKLDERQYNDPSQV
jgi:hypothetical protein